MNGEIKDSLVVLYFDQALVGSGSEDDLEMHSHYDPVG